MGAAVPVCLAPLHQVRDDHEENQQRWRQEQHSRKKEDRRGKEGKGAGSLVAGSLGFEKLGHGSEHTENRACEPKGGMRHWVEQGTHYQGKPTKHHCGKIYSSAVGHCEYLRTTLCGRRMRHG